MIQKRETGGRCRGLQSNIGLRIWTVQQGDHRIPEVLWSNAPTVKTIKTFNNMVVVIIVVMTVDIDGSSILCGAGDASSPSATAAATFPGISRFGIAFTCTMVCVKCGRWAYQGEWFSSGTTFLGRRQYGYADPNDDSLFWFIICKPDCHLNALRHASYQLEQEVEELLQLAQSHHYIGCSSIRNRVEELRWAWVEYYAYV